MESPRGALDLEVDDDFGRLFELYDRLPERSAAAPTFDPQYSELIGGFWVKGTDRDSRSIVHLQALGLIDLGRATLAEHLRERPWLYHPYGEPVAPDRCAFPARGARQITGLACYQGELWVRPGPNGLQGFGVARKLVRMAMLWANDLFAPDYLWALVSERNARARFPQRWGYANLQADGAVWRDGAGRDLLHEWLIWSSRKELVELAAQERNADVLGRVAQYHEDRPAVG